MQSLSTDKSVTHLNFEISSVLMSTCQLYPCATVLQTMFALLQGSDSSHVHSAAAEQCARQFSHYEQKWPAAAIEQGIEPEEFRKAFKMLPQQQPRSINAPNVGH